MKVSLRSRRFGHYRGECADAPGWYPTSTLAASASHAPAARLGNPPPTGWKQTSRWTGQLQGSLSRVSDTVGTFKGNVETDGCPCFSALRRRGEREGGKKSGGNITLASPPSRRFLTRPHCVLLPHKLSLSPAPTSYVPDCCSCFFSLLLLL